MDSQKINNAIDSAFDSAFTQWKTAMHKELYPAAFADEYSWLRVENSFKINNKFLKEALKEALTELLCE